jgi:RHS repeat-associated protein
MKYSRLPLPVRAISFLLAFLMFSESFITCLFAIEASSPASAGTASGMSAAASKRFDESKKREFRIKDNNHMISRAIARLNAALEKSSVSSTDEFLKNLGECENRLQESFADKRLELLDSGASKEIIARHDAFVNKMLSAVRSQSLVVSSKPAVENNQSSNPQISKSPNPQSSRPYPALNNDQRLTTNDQSPSPSISQSLTSQGKLIHRKDEDCRFRPGENSIGIIGSSLSIPKNPPIPQIAQSPNPQIAKSPNPQIAQSPNLQIAKSPNLQIAKSPNPQIAQSPNPQIAKSPNLQIAQSPKQSPSGDDLSASPEALFTPEITALARSLLNNPVLIYEYVRNNFKYEPYYGCIKGAAETLLEGAGNDTDIASLAIALLRTSGIPARYARGYVRIPSQIAMEATGAATPELAAATFIRNGVPASAITEGGKITGIRIERIWVRALINPHPYLGIAGYDEGAPVWLDLDPAFKTSSYSRSRDIASETGFDPDAFLTDIKARSVINNPGSYVTALPESFILETLGDWGDEVGKYLYANGMSLETAFRNAAVNQENFKTLPLSFPYKLESASAEWTSLPQEFLHKLTFRLHDATGAVPFTVVRPIYELVGKRITLSFRPATSADGAVIDANIASPDFPAYLINLVPQLKLDGLTAAAGIPLGMGSAQTLTIDFSSPDGEFETISHNVLAGGFYSIGLNPQKIPLSLISRRKAMLEASLLAGKMAPVDDTVGETLHLVTLNYYYQIDSLNSMAAGALEVNVTRRPSELVSAYDIETESILGVPVTVRASYMKLDVRRDLFVPVAVSGRTAQENQFMIITAMTRSSLEHNSLEQMFRKDAVSAVRIIQAANNAGIPIYTVNAATLNSIIPKLSAHSGNVIADIRNAIAAGATVTVPETRITYANWTGSAYIIMDPDTGASSYMLEKGINGGEMKVTFLTPACLLDYNSSPLSNFRTSALPNFLDPALAWLTRLKSSTDEVARAYVPATASINRWFRDSATLDNAATVAACIAVSSPITDYFAKPSIFNVSSGENIISPNGDGVKDAFAVAAETTSGATWAFTVKNSGGQTICTQTGSAPAVRASFSSPVPDGAYSYEISAQASGLYARPVTGSFYVDLTKPVAAITAPAHLSTVRGSLVVSGTADDANFQGYSVKLQSASLTPVTVASSTEKVAGGALAVIDTMQFPLGNANIILEVADKAGNVSSVSCNVTLDNDLIPPAVTVAMSANGVVVPSGASASGSLNVNVTAADASGIKNIKLLLDGVLVASNSPTQSSNNPITQSSNLSWETNSASLSTGSHLLSAEAYDPAGNRGAAQFQFTNTAQISNFKVNPTLATAISPNITVSATLSSAAAWTLSFSGPSAIPTKTGSDANISVKINGAAYQDGNYTVTLSSPITPDSCSLPFTIDIVSNPPVATITSPSENQNITDGLFTLTGTATDPDSSDAVSYKVSLADIGGRQTDVTPKPLNAQGRHEGRVENGNLGTLDLTMVQNGSYTLTLLVSSGPDSVSAEVPFALSAKLKIGQFTFSQQDMVIPAGGQPITVTRNYDSLRAQTNDQRPGTDDCRDFGPGWVWSMKDVEMKINETRSGSVDTDGHPFSMRTGGGRNVDITLPDGQRVTFTYILERDQQNFCYHALWAPPPGVHATLFPSASDKLVTIPGIPFYWAAAGMDTPWENFDFPGFILTMKDGSKYALERQDTGEHFIYDDETGGDLYVQTYGAASLKRITQLSGDRIEFSEGKIEQFNAEGVNTRCVSFQRDGMNRVIAIYDPKNLDANGNPAGQPYVTYEYDPDTGNLIKVNKLEDGATYRTTEYIYANPARPHFITSVKDPRGLTPIISEYDDTGRLVATIDAFGNRVSLNHDIAARTETVFDRSGNPTVYRYNSGGNVISTTDALGNTSASTYDSSGNTLSFTDPLGNTTVHTYDSQGNCTSVTDPLGGKNRYSYDGYGNLISATDPLGNNSANAYDARGNLVASSNALGHTNTSTYDQNSNLISTTNSIGITGSTFQYDRSGNMTSTTDINGATRSFAYDVNGNQTRTSYIWTDPSGNGGTTNVSTSRVFNSAGQVISCTDPDGNSASAVYDEMGKPFQTTDILGNTTTTVYDDRGDVIETQYSDGTVSRTVYDADGRALATQDRQVIGQPANGSRSVYDLVGRVIRSERLSNMVISVTVNGASKRSQLTSAGNVVSSSSSTYDRAGRVVASTSVTGAVTRHEYDAAGRSTAVIDHLGNRKENEYDVAGRQLLIRDALGRTTRYEYDALGRRVRTLLSDGTFTTVTYNALGQKIKETDQAGIMKNYSYDNAGRLASVILPSVPDPVNPVNPVYSYAYDMYGHLSAITDPKGRNTSFSYDALGRQISRKMPAGQTESKAYNNLGQLYLKTDFKGQTTEFSYDSFGRLQSQLSAGAMPVTISYEYDNLGRQHQVTDARGATKYTYDTYDRMLSITSPEGTVNYAYDAVTSRKTRTWTNNSDAAYAYDKLGRLSAVTVHKRNGTQLSQPEVTTYSYTAVGSRESISLPNGILTEYAYDNLNRLTSAAHYNSADQLLASFTYALAPTGRRTAVHEESLESDNQYSITDIAYTYDRLNRLTAESSTSTLSSLSYSNTYTYDLVGNRLQKCSTGILPVVSTSYSYNANDQLLTETSTLNGQTSYTYDPNGSLIDKNGVENHFASTYNARNQLATATIQRRENEQAVNISANYAYNHAGIRVRSNSTVNGIAHNRNFLIDSCNLTGHAQILEEFNNGSLSKSYAFGDDILSQSSISNSQFVIRNFLYDGHGNTRMLADNSGAITDRYSYDAYGIMLGGDPGVNSPAATDMLYSGEQFDVELQLQYLRARNYDQNTGRFTSLDSFAGNNSNPQTLHKYAYAHSNPVNGIDPSGLALYAFDGTGNYPTQTDGGIISPTNIFLMYSSYGNEDKAYKSGVGNEEEYSDWNPELYLGQMFGAGANSKIYEMYMRLIKYYNDDDHVIDIIGFSRGGVMALKFADLIMQYGIPKTEKGAAVNSLYLGDNMGDKYSSPEIRFLGLFDPVPGPTGMFYGLSNIPDNVQKTAIAYSGEEKRTAFQPLITSGKNTVMKKFPGGHSDTGGGYWQRGIAQDAMLWMVGEGGAPFSMPFMGNYQMSLEKVKHQEDKWYWNFGERVLPSGLEY